MQNKIYLSSLFAIKKVLNLSTNAIILQIRKFFHRILDFADLIKKIKDEYLLLFNIKLSVLRRNKVKIE